MNRKIHRTILTILLAAGGSMTAPAAHAQNAPYPSRPLRMIVPVPAAGPNDFVARSVGEYMSRSMGQPVVVENRPGANSQIGTEFVTKQPPDGYTLLQTAASVVLITAGSVLLGGLAVLLGPRWAVAAMGAVGAISIILVTVAMPKARHIR